MNGDDVTAGVYHYLRVVYSTVFRFARAIPAIKKIIPEAVGGEILPFNLLEALPKYWILIFALLLPACIIFYKKRDLVLHLISRII